MRDNPGPLETTGGPGASASLDRRTREWSDYYGDTSLNSEKRRKKTEGNKHQSRPSCLQRQTSDSSVDYIGGENYRHEKFELI